MTLKEMRSHVRSGVRDISGNELTEQGVDRLLNEGVKDVVLKTGIMLGRWERTTVARQELYGLPGDGIRIWALAFDNMRLAPTMDRQRNVRNNYATGTPTEFYTVTRGFGLIPIPTGVGTLTIDSIRFPEMMTQDDTECPLPMEMHQLPVLFAVYRSSFVVMPDATEMLLNRYVMETKRVQSDMMPEQLDDMEHMRYTAGDGNREWLLGNQYSIPEPR